MICLFSSIHYIFTRWSLLRSPAWNGNSQMSVEIFPPCTLLLRAFAYLILILSNLNLILNLNKLDL